MKKIVFFNSPGNLNVGNEFVNAGSEYLVRKALDDANIGPYNLYNLEFWQTSTSLQGKHQTKWNTVNMIRWADKSDLVLVSGGAIINKYTESILQGLINLRPPKVLLGAGMYRYDSDEKRIARKMLSGFDLVICRDGILHDVIRDKVSSISGIDMAFFLNDVYTVPDVGGDYAVVNIDFNILRRFQISKKYKELKKRFNKVYITENTSTLHKKADFVFLSRWSEFCNLYANATFVSTVRIHTAVLCTLFKTPFEYLGKDHEPEQKRNMLFKQFGMSLEKGKIYSREELDAYAESIRKKKENIKEELTRVLRNIF